MGLAKPRGKLLFLTTLFLAIVTDFAVIAFDKNRVAITATTWIFTALHSYHLTFWSGSGCGI